jgi:hypothetical protein
MTQGEIWQNSAPTVRSLQTTRDGGRGPRSESYRWNIYPFAIHLFYEPKQRAPGDHLVYERGWENRSLFNRWRGKLRRPQAAAEDLPIRCADPHALHFSTVSILSHAIVAGHFYGGVLEEMKHAKNA